MDVQSLKKYIRKKDKVEYVLSELGCHKVRYNARKEYYAAAMPDGDNPSGVVIYDNDYLNFISYSRNIGFDEAQDIVSLVQIIKKIDFVSAIKWLHKILDVKFSPYKKENKAKKNPLAIFRDIINRRKSHIDVAEIVEIEEEALDDFVPMIHIDWFREGIMPWARKKFGLCYSYKRKRMVVPIRYWMDGRLLGFNQRTMIDNWQELGIPKYLLTSTYQKSTNIYGLWENKDTIEKAGYVVVVESEKSVLKRYSIGDGTCVALQGKTMSDEQRRILLGLNVDEIIIALDKDVDINDMRCMCDKLYLARKVSYVKDDWGYLGDKDSPCDAKNEKTYNELIDLRIRYDKSEHKKYVKSLKK